MSSWINPCPNVVQRNWQPAVLPAAPTPQRDGAQHNSVPVQVDKVKDGPPLSAVFDLWREQQVLHSNSFAREFQTRKLMRQFFTKAHAQGSTGPAIMVLSHRFQVDVVSTDSHFVAGFTLGQGHSVRLIAPDGVTWHKDLCSSSLTLSEGGEHLRQWRTCCFAHGSHASRSQGQRLHIFLRSVAARVRRAP